MGETRSGVENPVENVDNRAGFPRRAAVILGDYVYQKLPLVVPRKGCRTVTSPVKRRSREKFSPGFFRFALDILGLVCYNIVPGF